MLPGSLAELTTWQYFSAAPSTASQCASHWQPLSACILVRLCTHIHHIYVYHDTDYGIKRIGGCCPSELSHVSGAEYNIQATAYHQHTYNDAAMANAQGST